MGSAGSSGLFGSAAGGSSLFGSPSMAAGLGGSAPSPHAATLGASLDSLPSSMAGSMAGSPFPQATLASGLPPASAPHAFAPPRGAAFAASPPGCASPFPSPAAAGGLGRQGLPPLPGGRQASLGTALAAAGAAGGGSPLPAARVGSPGLATAMDTDQLLSMRLQDALFVGSPAAARAASPQAAAAQRASLFAALAGHGVGTPRGSAAAGGAAGEADDDADSVHLLSSSLSCLEDGTGTGRGLLARSISGLSASSGLTESFSGGFAAAAAALRGDTPGLGGDRLASPGGRGDAASDGSGSSGAQRVPDAGGNSDEVGGRAGGRLVL